MRVYLAGPFFNKKERANIEQAEKILRAKNLELFVPMEHKIENGESMPNDVWGKLVFEMDKQALYDCDIVVALYYGMYSDSGTAWEIGFANCLNKPVIIVHCNTQKESSLMIVNGSYTNLENIQKLKNFDFNNIKKTEFLSHKPQK